MLHHRLTLQTDTPPAAPRLDEPAPYFEGRSTQGPIKLSDYAGRWLVFFAHPADFDRTAALAAASASGPRAERRRRQVLTVSSFLTRSTPGADHAVR